MTLHEAVLQWMTQEMDPKTAGQDALDLMAYVTARVDSISALEFRQTIVDRERRAKNAAAMKRRRQVAASAA